MNDSNHDQIRQLQKKYGQTALMVAIFISLGLFVFGLKAYGKGLILGTLFSIFNFILLGESLPKKLLDSKRKSVMMSLGIIYIRYILLAVPLIISLKNEDFSTVTTAIGIFMIQILILLDHVAKRVLGKT